ncbi:MAG: hypothetical protein H7Z12_15450 [Rhodospirillaceae bacterium]|nr:hypothetical protein [Rhodospirillales bacterium]
MMVTQTSFGAENFPRLLSIFVSNPDFFHHTVGLDEVPDLLAAAYSGAHAGFSKMPRNPLENHDEKREPFR